MENKIENKKQHMLTMENRAKLTLSGVEKVINSADTFINLVTSFGELGITGKDFKIEHFSLEDGSLTLSGTVDCLKYSAKKSPLLKRIFR